MNKDFDYNKIYYKITNKRENHNGFQFKDGLNEDTVPFNRSECSAGGIYFSDIINIFWYLYYIGMIGYYIREVKVPEDAKVSIENYKYKASKIILGERKELNLNTLKELISKGANIHISGESVLCWASTNGHLDVVKYLVDQYVDIHNGSNCALEWASSNGHLDVVKYLVEHGANLHDNYDSALFWSIMNGHLDVVKYITSLELNTDTYEQKAMLWAYQSEQMEILKYLHSVYTQ